jgi:hypothetical protein
VERARTEDPPGCVWFSPVLAPLKCLPLNTAGIWVRTNNGVIYSAMFQGTIADDLKKLLEKAQIS